VQQLTGYRLSPQQRTNWKLAAGGRSEAIVELNGLLDQERLQQALAHVVQENEILRTVYVDVPGMAYPMQVPVERANVVIEVVEGGEHSVLLRQLGDQQVQRQEQDPVRTVLVLTSAERNHLLLSWPTLSVDLEIQHVVAELAQAYEALVANEDKIQYAVAADIFNEMIETEDGEPAREFWHKQDVRSALTVQLPFAERTATYQGAAQELNVSAERKTALTQVAAANGATLEETILAAWIAFLGRYTGQEQVLVGTSCNGRVEEEIATAIGAYARYVPFAQALDAHMTFATLVQHVGQNLTTAREWQDGFEGEAMGVEAAALPFGFDAVMATSPQAGAVTFRLQHLHTDAGRFQLRLAVQSVDGELKLVLHYNETALPAEVVARLAASFETLLGGLAQLGDGAVGTLPLLQAADREQLLTLARGDDQAAEFQPLHVWFEAQVQATPNQIAVRYENTVLTYAELNQRANALARVLQEKGAGRHTQVALLAERSLELVVGLLATLKSGASYVPVDPEYPAERIAYMLEHSQASVVLTHSHLTDRIADGQAAVVLLDATLDATVATDNLDVTVTADDAAYVIYTSGSTGKPKGVVLPQRAIVNHMRWMLATFPLMAADVVLQKTAFSFDASVWEFYAPLLSGAQLVMARPGGHADPEYLVQAVQTYGVTTLQLVPAMLQLMTTRPAFGQLTTLRRIFCGGEALSTELAERVQGLLSADVINLYGPTESCIDATAYVVAREPHRTMPIGRPIHNVQAYVLDEFGALVPQGVPGELYLGGAGLALGYLHNQALTDEKFAVHQLAADRAERLYQTGDLVVQGADGTLEYLGRLDHQVKLRGFRIELGEIEAVLEQHADLQQVAVTVCEVSDGQNVLVAYVVSSTAVAEADILAHAKSRLPEYMVPSVIVPLDAFPLTPNGKIDRRALPTPNLALNRLEATYVEPSTEIEALLADIWSDVLGVEQVGTTHSFFELGGHSLLATQIVYRLRDQLEVDIPLRSIFEAPTIAEFAVIVEDILFADLDADAGDLHERE